MTAAAPGNFNACPGHGDGTVLLYDLGRVLHGRVAEMLMQHKLKTPSICRIAPAGRSDVQVFVSR